MEEYQDFKEFIKLLIERKVEYLIVGGFAVTFHSREKFTADIDFWIRDNKNNVRKLLKVFDEFGFSDLAVTEKDFERPGFVLQLGYAPKRIDIMVEVEGLSFNDAYKKSKPGKIFGNLNVRYISFDDLIKNKEKLGRPKDKFDIEWMKKYNNKKSR